MPDKASRTNSVTQSESVGVSRNKREDDVDSVDMVEELEDEAYDDDESCEDEPREMRVRFKVRDILTVINSFDSIHWQFEREVFARSDTSFEF